MSVKKTVSVSDRPQLIDLNGETTNFDLTFTATSQNRVPFDLVVVDQDTLDNNPNIEFKRADQGTIQGNIISDKNVYQSYFLYLKSDQPCEVDVTIDKKEIPPQIIHPPQAMTPPAALLPPPKKSGIMKSLILVGVLVGVGALVYYLYFSKSSSNDMVGSPAGSLRGSPSGSPGGVLSSPPTTSFVAPPVASPSVAPPVANFGTGGANARLLARLNSLPVR